MLLDEVQPESIGVVSDWMRIKSSFSCAAFAALGSEILDTGDDELRLSSTRML